MPGPVYTAGRTPLASDIVDAGGVMQALRLLPPQPFVSRKLAQPPAGPVPVAESVNASNGATGGNAVFSITPSKVGNLLVMVLHMGTSTTTVTNVTDNQGRTWKKAGDNPSTGNYTTVWYLENCPAGISQVTAFLSASTSFSVNVTEWAGLALSGALRAVNTAVVSAGPNTSGTAVAVAGDLAIGGITANSSSLRFLATPGWTEAAQGAAVANLTARNAYKHSTGGTEEAQWNTTSATATGGVIAVFSRTPLLGLVAETDLAQPITALKITPVGLVAEADAALDITQAANPGIFAAVGQVLETDSVPAISRLKLNAANQAAETDTAQVVVRVHRKTTGLPTEASTGQPVARRKLRALAQPTTTDAAQPAAARKMRLLGQPSTADAVQPVTRAAVGIRLAIGQALQADTAQPVTRIKRGAVGQPADQGTANPLVRTKILVLGQAVETDTAAELLSAGSRVVGRGMPRVTGATAVVGLGGVATAPTLATATVAVGLEGLGRAAQVVPRSEVRTR